MDRPGAPPGHSTPSVPARLRSDPGLPVFTAPHTWRNSHRALEVDGVAGTTDQAGYWSRRVTVPTPSVPPARGPGACCQETKPVWVPAVACLQRRRMRSSERCGTASSNPSIRRRQPSAVSRHQIPIPVGGVPDRLVPVTPLWIVVPGFAGTVRRMQRRSRARQPRQVVPVITTGIGNARKAVPSSDGQSSIRPGDPVAASVSMRSLGQEVDRQE
jgi:hypothetical protein